MVKNDRSFNCAQTGLGKTFTTITAAIHKAVERKEDDIHFVILAPVPAVKSFTDTIATILGLPFNIYTATSKKVRQGARFHIFNYSSLPSGVIKKDKQGRITQVGTNQYFETLKKLKAEHPNLWLIADEAHVLQDPNAIQYMFMRQIMPIFVGAWFLTATPILNNLDGLFHMTDLLKQGFWGNLWRFKNSYQILESRVVYTQRGPQKTMNVVGYKNLDVMQTKFNEIAIIRANKYPIELHYRSVPMGEAFNSYYNLASQGMFAGTVKTKKTKDVQTHGARLHDLQRVVSNSHKELKFLDQDQITEKEQLLIKTIQEVSSRDEAVLVYFTYRETLDRVKYILNKLKTSLNIPMIHEIHGDISINKRKAVEKNINPRDVVLITSAGTESVNLQRANNLIFYEVPFALREFIQACGRITRTDTKFDTFDIYILEAENTIDTYKKNRIIANSEVITNVVGGADSLPTSVLEISLADIEAMKDELLWGKR